MQLLAEFSAENDTRCLGVYAGGASRLRNAPGFPVPNMGWCRVMQKSQHELFSGIPDRAWFYFVHSYALPDSAIATGVADHDGPFAAVVSQRNFHATQFHPERSSAAGARLLRNFLELQA
jgi:glutamine amidotransferase